MQDTEEIRPVPYAEATPLEEAELWDDELPGRPLRKRLGPLTLVLAALLIAGGAFYAGVRVEKGKVGSSSSSSLAALASRFASRAGATATTGAGSAGGAGAGGAGGGLGGAARGATIGTIALVDGSNVYVRETDGTVVKVSTNPATTITASSTATVSQLHPGDAVIVSGSTGSDGTVAATAVRDQGASGANPITSSGSGTGSANRGAGGGGGFGGFGG